MAVRDFTFEPKKTGQVGTVSEPLAKTSNLHSQDEVSRTDLYDTTNVDKSVELHTFQPPAFEALDMSMKEYFSDIQVPTKDGLRPENVNVRLSGGDKTILIWKQDLKAGRIKLPVMAITRSAEAPNPEKYSPPYIPAMQYFLDNGSRVKQAFRPVPYLIEYTLAVWTERKRDMEHVIAQVLPRMNPLATFKVDDGKMIYTAVMKMNSCTNNSDIDIGAEELAKVRYDISVTVEGYIPVAHTLTKKTVLGRVGVFREMNGKFLDTVDVGNRNRHPQYDSHSMENH
jgi:hypothetical protein